MGVKAFIRKWLRRWGSRRCGWSPPAVIGTATFVVFGGEGTCPGPTVRTVLRRSRSYAAASDVEIRGFLDGEVKFERNVATQYHVRIGCEGSKPIGGRYEVMRVLERWSLAGIPPEARVLRARLVLSQEDTSSFPHRYPLRWPTDFYLYEVKKPWSPGRGGTGRDNCSRPEPGDAWWREARAGELAWAEPGCGFGSDSDPKADRAEHAVASARLESVASPLVFEGPRFAALVERSLRGTGTLDLLIKASGADEIVPGSVKTFFSAEYGDDWNPRLRPTLILEWTASCIGFEEHPFVLEPGQELAWKPSVLLPSAGAGPWTAALSLEHPDEGPDGPCVTAGLGGWKPSEGAPSPNPDGTIPLLVPARGTPEADLRIHLSAAVNPVLAGETVKIEILETWAPSVARPEDLSVRFRFGAPSKRSFDLEARHLGDRVYAVEFRPDEMGVWSYAWSTSPDPRFREQRGGGRFTVVRSQRESQRRALAEFTDGALRDARSRMGPVHRRRCHHRLMALQSELRALLREEESRPPPDRSQAGLREILERIATALPELD